MRKPDFFIVGAPKCGTTSIYDYLSQHPEIFMAKKELHFFASDLITPWLKLADPQDTYLSYFTAAKNEKRLGDASVWHLYSEKAAYSIKKFCPTASIIILLRNPVDMLYSYHSFFYRLGKEDIANFEVALEVEDERKQGLRLPKWLYNNNIGEFFPVEGLFYREVVKYSSQVKRYLECFGRENVHVIIFDDLKKNTAEVYKQTLIFLEVTDNFEPEIKVKNPGLRRRVRSETLRKVVRNPVSLWLVKTLNPQLNEGFFSKLLALWGRLNNRYEPLPPIDHELRMQLQKEFLPEIEQLSQLLDRDLTFWCKD